VGGVTAFGLLQARRRGYRSFEVCMGAVLGVILLAFCFEAARAWPSPQATFLGLEPGLAGQQQALLAVGIVGATVMPHAIYLHSYLATERRPTSEPERRRMLFGEKVDVFVALGVAGAVNVLMLLVAARLFREHHGALGLGAAHALLLRQAGGLAALVFSVALFTSGLSSSAVGTYAGQVVMQSLTPWRVPPWARRAVSVVPAVALLVAGVGATRALVWSQVVLAFGVPAALVPLVWLCASRDVMGTYASRAAMTAVALAVALVIIGLDLWLVAGV
jgi:manganese transport protein